METGYYSLPDMDNALESLVYTGNTSIIGQTFLHGLCGIFALALHDTYGYELGWLLDDDEDNESDNPWHHLVHVFCYYTLPNGDTVYVDIRGSQTDEKKLEAPFEDFYVEPNYVLGVSYEETRDNICDCMGATAFEMYYAAACEFIRQERFFYSPSAHK